jgi:ubiquinone/menaquinone biosynthesis C-methylase UbiE
VISRFGPDPLQFFNGVYPDVAPWDIGGAQPALEALVAECPPEGPILDVGCGSGDLAIALASTGHTVVGVDFVETAISQAREKSIALPPSVADRLEFRVGDALHPSRIAGSFRSVVDSGFLHLFNAEERDRFIGELAATIPPGGRYYLLAFAVTFPIPNAPEAVTEDEVRARFSRESGWLVRICRHAEFLNRVAPPVPATCACIERLDGTIRLQ